MRTAVILLLSIATVLACSAQTTSTLAAPLPIAENPVTILDRDHQFDGGSGILPLSLRFIGRNAIVTSLASADPGATRIVEPGDALTDLDGQTVNELVAIWKADYAASNQAARLRNIASAMTKGLCGPVSIGLLRDSKALTVKVNRVPATAIAGISRTHDLPGNTFRLLSDQVAYLKLSSAKIADIDQYLERAAKTKGLIIDIRNYPSEFVVFALGSHLVEQPTPFAKFTSGDLSNPGAFHWGTPLH